MFDPNNLRPLDATAFHYYPPNIFGGVHRSRRPENQHNKFDIIDAGRQAANHFANQIRNFVMDLKLTAEQRRYVFWRSLALSGMREMVFSFGLPSASSNIGLFIAANVSRFLQRARLTTSTYGRVSDPRRRAVASVLAGCVATPERKQDGTLSHPQSHISGRTLLSALGIEWGSGSRLL